MNSVYQALSWEGMAILVAVANSTGKGWENIHGRVNTGRKGHFDKENQHEFHASLCLQKECKQVGVKNKWGT